MTSVTLGPLNRLSKQVVIALMIVVLVTACGGDDEPAATPTVEATAAAGGMVMPTTAAATQAAPATLAPTAAPALLIGDTVQALPEQQVRLYTDATTSALVMGVYAPGERFTVLDPSGEYALYPVENEGRLWYRLRAGDGLVGWGAADQIGAAN